MRKYRKFREKGIVWIDDSSIYVADKSLFKDERKFLNAVLEHIKEVVKDPHGDEIEAGWWSVPEFERYIGVVTTSYMRHNLEGITPQWVLEDECITGHFPVWYVDFGCSTKEMVMRRMLKEPWID